MTRKVALATATIAGYHGDKRTFTRALIEARVALAAMQSAWETGVKAKALWMRCGCYECATKEAA